MLTPDYLTKVTEGAEEIASQLHIDIVNRIAERVLVRLGRGEDYLLTSTDKWQLQTLQQSGYLLEDIQREIQKRTKLQEIEIQKAMFDAGIKALQADASIYAAAGLSPIPLRQSPELMRLMQHNYEATLGEWKNYTRTMATEAQKTFIQAVDKAYHQTTTGALSYSQAVKEAVEEIAKTGVKITYPSGHTDTIETATARAVRTGISQASGDVILARLEEMDWDIILVSSHLGARPGDGEENHKNHEWWQGKFYSRTGRTKEYPHFSVCGYKKASGLKGINCRHSFGSGDGVNNPFEQYDSEENKKAYELSQKQRALERRIRNTKREVATLQTSVDNVTDEKLKFELQQELDKKSYQLQKQNKAYKEFCKDNELKPLNERLQIAEWDREKARRATGAAKRYDTVKAKTADMKQYEKYKEIFPEKIKGFAEFEDLKYNSIESWNALKADKQSTLNSMDFKSMKNLVGKLGNKEVRVWYKSHDEKIPDLLDKTATIKEQALQATNLRNKYRTQARDLMSDQITRKELDELHPNPTFKQLIERKMKKYGLSIDEAYEDIIRSSTTTNKTYDVKSGIKE